MTTLLVSCDTCSADRLAPNGRLSDFSSEAPAAISDLYIDWRSVYGPSTARPVSDVT
ncbi:hypothetical protein X961_6269 [Burkholderia pseudomallei MSHR5613]|nr:hypothetical protein X961_6269 [Burkholderia pseudomallei MSHR5613]KGX64511.1 hypothetical protein Y027_6256 [Burkholderia pseudomallei TSV5]